MSEIQRRLITYCSNIHPAVSWEESFAALREHVPTVKESVSPDRPFPLGLRLSARQAAELACDTAPFARWLEEAGCFVPTVNGFAYGAFHGCEVKLNAYLPDWHSLERAGYTKLLADLLSGWLPKGMTGSISTVPVGFKATTSPVEFRARLLDVLRHLDWLKNGMGADIVLALEPEPGCLIETAADFAAFLDWMEFPEPLEERIGICLDCCHHAVQFEEPEAVAEILDRRGVKIAKVQASSALRVGEGKKDLLRRFVEPCYLHQVVVKGRDGSFARYDDLPEALEAQGGGKGGEWRCHFHVPLFWERDEDLNTTRSFVERLLPHLDPGLLLEVETYSWKVLPPSLRRESLASNIVREIKWLQGAAYAADRRH